LKVLPGALAVAERELIEAEGARRHAAGCLQARQDTLLLTEIDGKNAEIRAAQLRIATVTEQLLFDQAERRLAEARVSLHHLQAEHSSLRAIARLMAAGSD